MVSIHELDSDCDKVDYEDSDEDVEETAEANPSTIVLKEESPREIRTPVQDDYYREPSPDKGVHKGRGKSRRAPNPFSERSYTILDGEEIITNPLDEFQLRALEREERAQRQAEYREKARLHREYRFKEPSVEEKLKEYAGRSFRTCIIGPKVRTRKEKEERKALRERYLNPVVTTPEEYRDRLSDQARGASVAPFRIIPIVLSPRETVDEEDAHFTNWVHKARRRSNLYEIRKSADPANVRLERKLRFDFAKLKAKGQLRSCFRSHFEPSPERHSRTATSGAQHPSPEWYSRTPPSTQRSLA